MNEKIVFMGTSRFAVPSLKLIYKNKYEIVAVYTQPDKPQGRGNKIRYSPVKMCALNLGLPIYQSEKISAKSVLWHIYNLNPDSIVVISFGQMLPKTVLNIPLFGCVNLHASLLPKYRGAAPIQRVIINGEKETGNTTILIDEGLDTGDILLAQKIYIDEKETMGQLHDKMSVKGAYLLQRTLEGLFNKKIKPIKQNNENATYAPKINKTTEKINWKLPAQDIVNLIRSLNPYPGAYSLLKEKILKIWSATPIKRNYKNLPVGIVAEIDRTGIFISCGQNSVKLDEIQIANKNKTRAVDFANSRNIVVGDKLV